MRSRLLITIWPAIHFYSKLTISLLTILSKTGPWSERLLHVSEVKAYAVEVKASTGKVRVTAGEVIASTTASTTMLCPHGLQHGLNAKSRSLLLYGKLEKKELNA